MKDIVYRVTTINELHAIAGFEKPKHPLISVIDYSKVNVVAAPESGSFVCSFYTVNFKKNCHFMYGRQPFDHQEGTLICTAPEQIITFDRKRDTGSSEGWGLYFHPELIRNSNLGKKIHEYSFFSYEENEALHLSDEEKQTLLSIIKQMENEYNTNIDHYSHELIISNIELFLNYCKRYYGRQFITRTNQNKDLIVNFENFLSEYVNSDKLRTLGIPSVKHCAEAMNLSANYFGDLLKSETGKNAQEHIHYFLLELAKNLLVSSEKRINEIAYDLGFEYPQNFSKLFKKKVGLSPTDFRNEKVLKQININ
jgi:AraC-like DNA-binding protein